MRKLTTEQKIEILEEAEKILKDGGRYYICTACEKALNYSMCSSDIFIAIPELLKYKPEKPLNEYVWYSVYDPNALKNRVQAVRNTIKDLKKT